MTKPSLVSFFLDTAAAQPDRPALWADDAVFSYADLYDAAARVAAALDATVDTAAATPFIGLFCRRSADAYVGLLGVLLSGRAYMPLSPKFPADRNALMMARAEAATVIVDAPCLDDARAMTMLSPRPLTIILPGLPAAAWGTPRPGDRVLGGNDLPAPIAVAALQERAALTRPDDFAYLLFTSGSTGQPKGVAVTHHNVVSYISRALERYQIQPEDRCTQLFELTFDPSIQDMFSCWGGGGCLYCVPDGVTMAPDAFARQHGVTIWYSVPAVAGMMGRLGRLKPGRLPGLRWMLFCGEALPTSLLPALRATAPNAVIENLYGPTETTIIAAIWKDRDDEVVTRSPAAPIGDPVPGLRARVVDEHDADVDEGELLIGGPQVTPGYWRAPELTAERFFDADGARWYRTGDRVARHPVHGLLYLGRMDQQVKIRGFRVEIAEVEKAVREAAGSDLAAVVPWRPAVGNSAMGLVAYVAGANRPATEIRQICAARLPDYMAPRDVRLIAEMPLNPAGKIDRRALAERLSQETGKD